MTVQIKTGNHGTAAPLFGPCLLWSNGWMDQDAIWYGGTSGRRPRCVRWEPSSHHKAHSSPLIFGRWLLWPNGWMDQSATWYQGRPQRRRHCVRWHVHIGKRFEPSTVLWAFHTIQPSSFNMEPRLKWNKNVLAWWPMAVARVWNSLKFYFNMEPRLKWNEIILAAKTILFQV